MEAAKCNYCEAHKEDERRRRQRRRKPTDAQLFACERCDGLAVYCGAACQSADWSAHEPLCDAVQRVRAFFRRYPVTAAAAAIGQPMKRRRDGSDQQDGPHEIEPHQPDDDGSPLMSDDDDDYDGEEEEVVGGGVIDVAHSPAKRARLEAVAALNLEHLPNEIVAMILYRALVGSGGAGAQARATSRQMYDAFDLAYRDLATYEFGWTWPKPERVVDSETGEVEWRVVYDTAFQREVVDYVKAPHELAQTTDAGLLWFRGGRNGWFLGYRYAVERRLVELFTADPNDTQTSLQAYVERYNHQALCVYVPTLVNPASGAQLYYVVPRAARNLELHMLGAHTDLPPAIGELTQLRQLHVWNTNLQRVPRGVLGKLDRVQDVDLSMNRLTKLPSDVGGMRMLRVLDINSNQLRHLPDAICELHELRSLNASENSLVDLPHCLDFEHLPHLLFLDISYNAIETHFVFSPLASFGQQTHEEGCTISVFNAFNTSAIVSYIVRRPLHGLGVVVNARGVVAPPVDEALGASYEIMAAEDKFGESALASMDEDHRRSDTVYFRQRTAPLPREAFPVYLHEVTFTDSLGRVHTLQDKMRCELDAAADGGVVVTNADDLLSVVEADSEAAAGPAPDDPRLYRVRVVHDHSNGDVIIDLEVVVDVAVYGGLTCAAVTAGMRHNRKFRGQPLPELECEP